VEESIGVADNQINLIDNRIYESSDVVHVDDREVSQVRLTKSEDLGKEEQVWL